jgi:hypothetical protein
VAGFERAVPGAHDDTDRREVRIDGDQMAEGRGFEAYRPAHSESLETSGGSSAMIRGATISIATDLLYVNPQETSSITRRLV